MKWISTKEAAEITGIAPQTLNNMRCQNRGPEYTVVGRSVRYEVGELTRYMQTGEDASLAFFRKIRRRRGLLATKQRTIR